MDFNTALRKASLGKYVPTSYKQRSRSSIHSNRLAQSQVEDWYRLDGKERNYSGQPQHKGREMQNIGVTFTFDEGGD